MSKTLLLSLVLAFPLAVYCQKTQQKENDELKALRNDFVTATNEYKASLAKLISIYEVNVMRAEKKLELSEKLLKENLISQTQVEEIRAQLAQAREKVVETKRRLENADKQIATVLDETKLAKEYKRAKVARRRARQRPCLNWDVMMSQRQTANSLSFSYKIVCR
jgi:multidrug resistance efflux pump